MPLSGSGTPNIFCCESGSPDGRRFEGHWCCVNNANHGGETPAGKRRKQPQDAGPEPAGPLQCLATSNTGEILPFQIGMAIFTSKDKSIG